MGASTTSTDGPDRATLFAARDILNRPRSPALLRNRPGAALVGRLEIWAMGVAQHLPPERLRTLQLERLRAILDYSRDRVPFWRGVLPPQARALDDLADIEQLPVLTRETIRAQGPALRANPGAFRGCFELKTSGSTSTPMIFAVEHELFYRRAFAVRYALKAFGRPAWSRLLRFNYRDLAWSVHQGRYVDLLEARKDPDALHRLVRRYRPDAFYGTVSYLLVLADALRDWPVEPRVKFVVSRSEYLSEEHRRYLETAFEAPVFSIYASREFGPLAQECRRRQGFHVNDERFLLEVVDAHGHAVADGQTGRVLVTSFDNRLMPFIRYEIGDLGRFLPGACGCGLSTRRIVFEGRACDLVYLPDGGRFPLLRLLQSVNLPGQVKAYQFIQDSTDRLRLHIVPDETYNREAGRAIAESLRNQIGRDRPFEIVVETVDRIELLANGKSKLLISTLEGPRPA